MIYANLHDKVQTDFAKAIDSISHSKLLIKLLVISGSGSSATCLAGACLSPLMVPYPLVVLLHLVSYKEVSLDN